MLGMLRRLLCMVPLAATAFAQDAATRPAPVARELALLQEMAKPERCLGTTLLTDCEAQRVLRVDAQQRILRTWEIAFGINDSELLPDGHLLVGGEGAVVEFDGDGQEVWRGRVGNAGRVARLGVARR
jgi:hypothetical protein